MANSDHTFRDPLLTSNKLLIALQSKKKSQIYQDIQNQIECLLKEGAG